MSSPAESAARHLQNSPSEQPFLEEHLEEIFVRLPTAADLARASMVSVSFCRVIAGHAFLRRFRALHPPPLLGILSPAFLPAQPPHPSAAAARAFADPDAADFSCSFLPSRERWIMIDFRDGRALFSGAPEGRTHYHGGFWHVRDFAVCDPLHRRYLLLPAIPDDLAASVHQPDIRRFYHFLAPPGENEEEASFRVMCLVQCRTKLVLFVFSPGAGLWNAVTFQGWCNSMTGTVYPASEAKFPLGWRQYDANRYFFWELCGEDQLLMLDVHRLEISSVSLPPGTDVCMMAFVEAGVGRFGMFTILQCSDGEVDGELEICHLLYDILQTDGDGASQWLSRAVIPLPSTCLHAILGAAGGYLLLRGLPENRPSLSLLLPEEPESDFFSLDLRTFQLERFGRFRRMCMEDSLFAGFPPSLSPPII